MSGKENDQGPGTKQPVEEDPTVSLLKFPLRVLEVPIDDYNRTAEKLGLIKLPKLSVDLDPLLFPKKRRRRARKKKTKKKSISDDNGHAAQNHAEKEHQTTG